MKTNKLIILLVATLFLCGCSVDDYKIQGHLTEETLIESEASARGVLDGIYENIRPNGYKDFTSTALKLMVSGNEQKSVPDSQVPKLEDFYTNNVKAVGVTERGGLFNFYKMQYRTINLANIFIKTIEEKGINGTSKATQNTLVAEAKTLRAQAYFMLLRVFGQFYDSNSEYGVITTTEPITGFTYLKRAKVNETYEQIIADLEFALKHASNNQQPIYVTKTFVKALLAKVYLYKGGADNWAKTIVYCKDIIDNLGGQVDLVPNYRNIFTESFKSKEVIFAPFYNKSNESSEVSFMNDRSVTPSDYFNELASSMVNDTIASVEEVDQYGIPTGNFIDSPVVRYDPRYKFTFKDEKYSGESYQKYPSSTSTFYYMRVAEVYLMYSEAIARTNGVDMQVAVNAINTVRKRGYAAVYPKYPLYEWVKAPEVTFTNKATLLEDIRKEKMLELHLETGETWFDLVRYDRLGDLQISTLKSDIKNENQLIFPIPLRVRTNNPNFGPQNPGY